MQDCDLLTLPPRDALTTVDRLAVVGEPNEEPQLRYDVESLQHWIDLNA